jgi:antitoxin component of MazEF toxin-antitoxin module
LDLQDGDRVAISVTADKAVVIAMNVPNRGKVDLSGTGDTILDHTYKAESSGVYRILINSTWPENQMAGCAGQDAGVQYEYIVERPGYGNSSESTKTDTKVEEGGGSIRLGPVGNCGASADWPRSEHSEKLDLQDGDRVTISVTADKSVVIAMNVPNRGRVALSGTGDTILDHTYKAESSGVYRILINSTWPENQMAGCAGQDAGVQYEYTVKR